MKAFDIYGKSITLTIHRSEKMKTKIGLVCTILTFIAFAFAFISFGIDLFYKSHPRITIKEQVYENDQLVIMNSTMIPNRTVIIQTERYYDKIGSFVVINFTPGTNPA